MIKTEIEQLLLLALTHLKEEGYLHSMPSEVQLEATRDKQFGDLASNVAMLLAKAEKKPPREIANKIIGTLKASPFINRVEVAGPGFLNFFLAAQGLTAIIPQILREKTQFGSSNIGQGKKILIEFVSSNPTGPLHVGHGRHAVVGDVVSNLLTTIGYQTSKEYYVNDAGRQMDILTVSIWVRYLNLAGIDFPFPANGYQGGYIKAIAQQIWQQRGKIFVVNITPLSENLPNDEPAGGDKEKYIDALIVKAKGLLGNQYLVLHQLGLESILTDIKADLAEFGVLFDNWCSEQGVVTEARANHYLQQLETQDDAYKKEGALWFRASKYGDEKDRVLVRANGQRTYFANDVIYHLNKFERGFDVAIGIVGSDHHGYIPRMKASMASFAINPERLTYILLQFVSLYRNGQPVPMSTRAGEFVTLRELREEVGKDAARYFYVMRKCEQPMDFDLDLAKAKTNENPVYYVQYAHARIFSVFKQLRDRQLTFNIENGLQSLALLNEPIERELLNTLSRYPDILVKAATQHEPSLLTNYLREVATHFHAYYNSQQFLVADNNLRDARLAFIKALQQILQNGFHLLGISAPEVM